MEGHLPPDKNAQDPLNTSEKEFLKKYNDDAVGWAWPSSDTMKWTSVTQSYQEFYRHWRSGPDSKITSKFPYRLSFRAGDSPPPLLFHSSSILGDEILITRSYNDTFHRLLNLRMGDKGSLKGAVLTGQPGIGKTTFLGFMFVRLISARQVVILCDATDTYLFYRGEVYNRRTVDGFSGLPRFRGEYCPVWALLDGDFKGGPPITTTSNIWPIHTTSPNPERWKAWSKQNMAAVLGMPLWNMEELIEGLSLWPEYEDFRSILAQHLLTLNTTGNVVVDAALEVLRAEREGEEEEEEERDRDATGHGTGSSAANQDATTSGKATWEAVDHALKILVRNATEEFGFAPRDVYRGVFRLPTIRMEHADAVKSLNCSQLKTIAEVFSKDCQLDVSSHHVVSVSPCDGSPDRDKWTIDFKSIRIAKEVVVSMRLEEDRTIRKVYGLLHDVPASSAMAGRIFESIVHRMFSGGEEEIMWAPIPMTSNDLDPPAFSVVPYPTYFLKMRPRALTQVNLNRNLKFSNITLDNDKYYTPTASTNPLFDSFIIDSDSDNTVLSIFQITTSPRSGGSGSGYLLIRKIMTRVCELLEEKHKTTNVQVEYFLVCPQSEAQRVWQMPFDWGKNITKHDHRGDAFFIPVPTSLV